MADITGKEVVLRDVETGERLIPYTGAVKKVNGLSPDASGSVSVDVGVTTVNGTAPDSSGDVPLYTAGTDDLTPGTSALATGKLYLMYE